MGTKKEKVEEITISITVDQRTQLRNLADFEGRSMRSMLQRMMDKTSRQHEREIDDAKKMT